MKYPSHSSKATRPGVKRSMYIPGDVFEQMIAEANRQQRSISWLVSHCWRACLSDLKKIPDAGIEERS